MIERFTSLDFQILDFIQQHISYEFFDRLAVIVSILGGVMIWSVIGIILLFIKKYRIYGFQVLVCMVIAIVLSEFILKLIVMRERPFETASFSLIVDKPFGSSFPSTHTMQSFSASIPLFWVKRKYGVISICFACMVGLSRMYLYVHFPSDVIFAAIIGIITGLALTVLINSIIKKFHKQGELQKTVESGHPN